MVVTLQPYNPAWAEEFTAVKSHLATIFEGVPVEDIVHVGSTSVPGLIAKPVIDVDIIVTEANLAAARSALSAAGYTDLGELGVPKRYAFRQPGFDRLDAATGIAKASSDVTAGGKDQFRTPLGLRRNTYIAVQGSDSLRNHLDLKRVLISDPEMRDKYGKVKESLAHLYIDDYCAAKTNILLEILAKAGWSTEELEEVAAANM